MGDDYGKPCTHPDRAHGIMSEGCETVGVMRVSQPHVEMLDAQFPVEFVEEAFQFVSM